MIYPTVMTGQRSGSKCCLQMDQFIFSYKVCLNSTMHSSLNLYHDSPSPSLAGDLGEHGVDHTRCTVDKPSSRGHVKYSCFTRADLLARLFICLFLLYPISTMKPFTTLQQFTFLKYLSKSIIVCRGQLLCSIIYHPVEAFTLNVPTVRYSTAESICNHLNCFSLLCTEAISGAGCLFPYVFSQVECPATQPCDHFVINVYGLLEYTAWGFLLTGSAKTKKRF